MKIKEALENEDIEFEPFYNKLSEKGIGDWNNINDIDTIKEYIKEKIDEDIPVSHILSTIEDRICMYDEWKIWLGNSAETPEPINSKQDLVDALGLDDEDLEKDINI